MQILHISGRCIICSFQFNNTQNLSLVVKNEPYNNQESNLCFFLHIYKLEI